MMFFEQRDHFRIGSRAVLNRIHTVCQRAFYPLRALYMGSHFQTQFMRRVAGCFDVFRRHFELARLALNLGVQHASGNH